MQAYVWSEILYKPLIPAKKGMAQINEENLVNLVEYEIVEK